MVETLTSGMSLEVQATVNISGKVTESQPDRKGTQSVAVRAMGTSRYRERVMEVTEDKTVKLTARRYLSSLLDKERNQAKQQIRLRPEVERILIERVGDISTIFSPDGSLTVAELDLLRAEAFAPALAGLLAPGAVKPGDQWMARPVAVAELTGVDPVESGQIRCSYQGVKMSAEGVHARVNFSGTLVGPTDQGPTQMSVDGHLLFDLDQRLITFVLLNGRSTILNASGQSTGQLEGRYELTRKPAIDDPRLSESSMKGLSLKPSPETTALLWDGGPGGGRFTYPRNWELISASRNVIQFEEPTGGSMQLTFDTGTAAEKLKGELLAWLKSQKASVQSASAVEAKTHSNSRKIERFTVVAEHENKEKIWVYLIVRQSNRSVAIATNLIAERAEALMGDASSIAESLQFIPKSP